MFEFNKIYKIIETMLKNILKLKGVEQINKKEQKKIDGGRESRKIPCGYTCFPWCNTGCPQ